MKLSACIIAKNEEKNLPRLLKSISGKFDEIILVDTGSTDRTKEIAKSFGCKVFEHKWNGFADARNRAVKEATGDWLWHFDADFELEEEEYRKAITLFKKIPESIEALSIGVKNFDSTGRIKAVSSHIFIHKAGIKWKGKVHESPVTEKVAGIPVFVNHYGYSDSDVMLKKAYRNLKLLKEEIAELSKDSKDYAVKLFFLVQTYLLLSTKESHYLEKAKARAEEFLRISNWDFQKFGFLLAYMFNYYLHILWNLKDYSGVEEFLRKVFSKRIKLPEVYFVAYRLYRSRKRDKESFAFLKKTAEFLDSVVENPFSLPWGGATECLPGFEREVFGEEPINVPLEFVSFLEKEWRRQKGRNLGLLLYWLSSGDRRLKILNKLVRRYRDPFLEKLLLNELIKRGDKDSIKRLSNSALLKELYLAAFYDLKGDEERALALYLQYLESYRDFHVALYVTSRFNQLLKSTGLPPIMELEINQERR